MGAPGTDRGGIIQAIRALRADGWTLLYVYDGGENVPASKQSETVESIMAVDDAFLHVVKGTEMGWVRFVMGNDPDEVICDYTTNLTCIDTLTSTWY